MLPVAYDLTMPRSRVVAVLSLCWFSTGAWGANLVVNGGFNGTTYTDTFGSVTDVLPSGWSLYPPDPATTSNINVVPATAFPGFPDPGGSGFYVAFMSQAQNGSEDCLYQYFNTVPGQTYTLSFQAAITSASPYLVLIPDWDASGTDRATIAVNGFNVNEAAISSQGPLTFQTFTFSGLTASLATTQLFFHGVDSQGAVLLGSVSVTPDNSASILWQNSNGDVVRWYTSGGKIRSSATLGVAPAGWSIQGTGDFNGVGQSDILWRNTTTGDMVIWFVSGGTVTSSTDLGVIPSGWTFAGTGDFNGDGKTDILWNDTTTGDVVIWFMNGGTIASSADLGVVPSSWTIAGTGDLNSDGFADILWRNTTTGDVVIWFMNAGTIASSADLGEIPSSWTVQAMGVNNGMPDILWRNTTSGDVVIWFLTGGTLASAADLGVVPSAWTIQGMGGFKGDGQSDILWRNTTSGDVVIWFLTGGKLGSSADLGVVPVSWTIQP
jgi:hypothetical protein